MTISVYAAICALINIAFLLCVYWILHFRRKSGKSDAGTSRISLVIASFVIPVFIAAGFVVAALISQKFYNYSLPVGQRGGGVFVILVSSVLASVATLIALLPRIKHRWEE